MDKGKIIQPSFNGGLNQCEDPSKIAEDEYYILSYGRIRENTIRPVKKHLDVTAGLPNGKMQGIYGTDDLLLVFVDGMAYYKDMKASSTMTMFAKVPNFYRMSATVDRIFVELVPAATLNYGRRSSDGTPTGTVSLFGTLERTPEGAIIQDGVTRPQIIYPSGFCRFLNDYSQWTLENREYVPIGKRMSYIDGVLYMISPDERLIYRSVTGRPTDFMVAITQEGNKFPDESEGRADVVSNAVSYYKLTDICPANSFGRGFFAGTRKSSHLVTPLDTLIYGEPTFQNVDLFSTGPLNPFSITDLNGDIALIDFNGLRSFNAMQSTSFEGKNSPFSRKIHNLFEFAPNTPVPQSITAAITYDNYGCFGMDSVYGPGILVYDCIQETPGKDKWVSFDLLDPINEGFVKQFCEIKVDNIRKLFFITSTNKVFEAWGSEETAKVQLYTKEWTSNDPEVENQPLSLRTVFLNCDESGIVAVTPFVDGQEQDKIEEYLDGTNIATRNTYPTSPLPFGERQLKDNTRNLTFSWTSLRTGWKMGFLIEWNFIAELSHLALLTNQKPGETSIEQESISNS